MNDLPNIQSDKIHPVDVAKLQGTENIQHAPRILILYGSLRERSFSRLCAEEAGRILRYLGAEVKIFNPDGLPLPDNAPETHPFQDIRFVLEDLGRSKGYISSVLKYVKKNSNSSDRKKYESWCLDESRHPSVSFLLSDVSYEGTRDQLIEFLDHLKLLAEPCGIFPNSKSALAWAFRATLSLDLGIDLGNDLLIKVWMQGWKVEMPACSTQALVRL